MVLHELILGETPYYTDDTRKLYERIQKSKLRLPDSISKECAHLLKKLLEKRPGDRITIQEIKQHAFFRDIDWDALLRKELDPPCLLLKADDLEVKGETY